MKHFHHSPCPPLSYKIYCGLHRCVARRPVPAVPAQVLQKTRKLTEKRFKLTTDTPSESRDADDFRLHIATVACFTDNTCLADLRGPELGAACDRVPALKSKSYAPQETRTTAHDTTPRVPYW